MTLVFTIPVVFYIRKWVSVFIKQNCSCSELLTCLFISKLWGRRPNSFLRT